MKPRNAIIILAIAFIVLFLITGFLYFTNVKNDIEEKKSVDVNKNQATLLDEQIERDEIIQEKIDEKEKAIINKLNDFKKNKSGTLTQEELDFIANPSRTVSNGLDN